MEYWEDYNKPVKGIVGDEFNGFDRWEDYEKPPLIFNVGGVTPTTNTSNFFLFF